MEALENGFLIVHAELPYPLQNLALRGAPCAGVFPMVLLCQGDRDLALLTVPLLALSPASQRAGAALRPHCPAASPGSLLKSVAELPES